MPILWDHVVLFSGNDDFHFTEFTRPLELLVEAINRRMISKFSPVLTVHMVGFFT